MKASLIKLNGNANHHVVTYANTCILFSYEALIAVYHENYGILDCYDKWDYSKTTIFYFKDFINNYTRFECTSAKQWHETLKSGVYHPENFSSNGGYTTLT